MLRHLTIIWGISLLWLFPGLGQAESLTTSKVIQLFIDNSLDLKIQNLKEQEAQGKTQTFLGLYDFILASEVQYTEAPFVDVSSFGTDTQLLTTTTEIQKRYPFGIRFAVGWDWLNKNNASGAGGQIPSAKGHISGLSLESQIPLLRNIFGTLNHFQLMQFKLNEHLAKIQTLKSITQLVEQGIGIYQQWHLAKRSVSFKQASLKRGQKLLNINLQKLKDGLLEAGDIAETRASVQAREIDLLTAKTNLDQASHTFAAFIHIDKNLIDQYQADELDNTLTQITPHVAKEDLWSTNVDVVLAHTTANLSTTTLQEKAHDRMVDLNAVGRITLKDADANFSNTWDNLFFDHPTYFAGVTLTVPLGNNAKEGVYQNAYLAKQRTDIELEKTKKQTLEAYTGKQTALEHLRQQIARSKKLLALQRQKLQHEELKFQQGRSSITRILMFQDDLTFYEHQHEQLLTNYVKTRIETKLMDASLLKEYQLALPTPVDL